MDFFFHRISRGHLTQAQNQRHVWTGPSLMVLCITFFLERKHLDCLKDKLISLLTTNLYLNSSFYISSLTIKTVTVSERHVGWSLLVCNVMAVVTVVVVHHGRCHALVNNTIIDGYHLPQWETASWHYRFSLCMGKFGIKRRYKNSFALHEVITPKYIFQFSRLPS